MTLSRVKYCIRKHRFRLIAATIMVSLLAVLPATAQAPPTDAIQLVGAQYLSARGGLSVDSVRRLPASAWSRGYSPADTKFTSVWLKFRVKNAGAEAQEVLLVPPALPKVALYNLGQPLQLPQRTGAYLTINQRSFPHYIPLLKVNLAPQISDTFLMELQTLGQRNLPEEPLPVIRSLSQQKTEDDWRLLVQGLFFGIILVMAFYNLMLYMAVRDISYLYYVLSIAGVGLYFFFYYGFSLQTIWQHYPRWNAYSFSLIVPLTGLARIGFTKAYLHTRQQLPWMNRCLNALAVLCLLPIIMGISAYSWGLPWYEATIDVTGIMGTLILISMLLAGTLTYLRGYTPALFFLLANLLFVVGANMFIIKEMSLVADSLFTRYAVQFGVSAQVVLFSLGLAYRLKKARQEAARQSLARERLEREKEVEHKHLIELQKQELEQQVNQRTAALQQKTAELQATVAKLQESEEGLRQLNGIKDKLYSIISHDLRGPVATLDSFISIITKHAEQISAQEWAKLSAKTRESVHNLSFLLDNLLNWSRAQMGNLSYSPEPVCLSDLVQKNLELYTLAAESKQLNLTNAVSKNLRVRADAGMLDFVVRNLLSNAIKYTPAYGSIRLLAQLENRQVKVSLHDSGIGLNARQLEQLQKAGSQPSRLGTAREKGTGLGLMLCKEFLAMHQAQLTIESTPGKGSSFSFRLPLAIELATEAYPNQQPDTPGYEGPF